MPVNLKLWKSKKSDQCNVCEKTASFKHILTGYEYLLKSYTWRYNQVLQIISKATKKCYRAGNKIL